MVKGFLVELQGEMIYVTLYMFTRKMAFLSIKNLRWSGFVFMYVV